MNCHLLSALMIEVANLNEFGIKRNEHQKPGENKRGSEKIL
jgi:hypothetical protein